MSLTLAPDPIFNSDDEALCASVHGGDSDEEDFAYSSSNEEGVGEENDPPSSPAGSTHSDSSWIGEDPFENYVSNTNSSSATTTNSFTPFISSTDSDNENEDVEGEEVKTKTKTKNIDYPNKTPTVANENKSTPISNSDASENSVSLVNVDHADLEQKCVSKDAKTDGKSAKTEGKNVTIEEKNTTIEGKDTSPVSQNNRSPQNPRNFFALFARTWSSFSLLCLSLAKGVDSFHRNQRTKLLKNLQIFSVNLQHSIESWQKYQRTTLEQSKLLWDKHKEMIFNKGLYWGSIGLTHVAAFLIGYGLKVWNDKYYNDGSYRGGVSKGGSNVSSQSRGSGVFSSRHMGADSRGEWNVNVIREETYIDALIPNDFEIIPPLNLAPNTSSDALISSTENEVRETFLSHYL